MKKLFQVCVTVCALSFIVSGCSKAPDDLNVNDTPDVSDFSITSASPIVPGSASAVLVSSTSLGNGTFVVNYDLNGNNLGSGLSASLVMAGNAGTFTTSTLANSGSTTLTVNSITDALGKTSSLVKNNVITLVDSTGLMNATIGSGNSFHTTDVTTSTTTTSGGTMLTITGTVWSPSVSGISISVYHYANATGTFNFNSTNNVGSVHYSATGVAQVAAYGSIVLTSVSPVIKGTFSVTNPDSSKINGSFTSKKI